ncbi:hypothetical protein [Sphingomonas jatrophae]|uniref:Uncharacterized protein, PEP-CTERM system associated n=1 Tax=Sphingomonas jatrophae TaxID=1166337 RepID=A0A1I6JY12_9SPHN|nr:hypothetical protein [Sphingomonas jatrophae]SFR83420.1 uncharacterized protein, PEP-CTERM system associated [Sphingomonas jatrophae]
MAPRFAIAGLLAASALAAPAAAQRTTIRPYVEANQTLVAQIAGPSFDDDVVTYTGVAAGVDGTIDTRRLSAGISYRYEHQFSWDDSYGDADTHSGVARLNYKLVDNLLDFEAGGIAARTRVDIRGFAPAIITGNQPNVAQTFGAYAGPTLATRVGDLDINALYRFGWVRVDNKGDLGLLPGEQRISTYDESTSHLLSGSVGMRPGELPFGWSVSGGYVREQVNELSQRFHDYYVRGDIVVPVSPTLAVTAGAGYEWIRSSSATPLIGPGGVPVLDNGGRYVKDPTQPRILAYDDTGIYYDAGVIWKPSRRTTLVATVGERYDQLAVTGSFNHQISSTSSVQVGVYNAVDSFGRSLNRSLSALPTTIAVPRTAFSNRGGGCVFSNNGANGPGGCFDDAFQSLATGDFRSRGVYAVYSASRGPLSLGFGAGYAQRRYLTPIYGTIFNIARVKDESVSAQANLGVRLSPQTTLENAIYVDWYKAGLLDGGDIVTGGATSALYHDFTGRLSGTAAAGVYATDQEGYDTIVSGQLLVGMRYQF